MSRTDETEVLVVGAGPVGMLTALLLAEEGIGVKVIDREYRTAAHTYACALHPATLQLLDRIGLAKEMCALGRPIESVAFYEGESRRAELKLADLPGEFRHALVLPQSNFEDLLEQRLASRSKTKVFWNHRLSEMRFEGKTMVAGIEKLAQTAKGYIVSEWDWTVQKELTTRAAYLVGADGHNSTVRSRLGIEYERLSEPEKFAVFEFETDVDPGNELRIVMDDATTNVLWPLPGNRCRWSFQLVKAADAGEFPEKDRESVRIVQHDADERVRRIAERLARSRAPWFKGTIKDVQWSVRISFEHRLAKQFGQNRAWLVGDAAHQTGPVGAQSMNAGLLEAEDLVGRLKRILRDGAPRQLLDTYERVHRTHWDQLLGRSGAPEAKRSAEPWVKAHSARILPCVPASGEHLAQLLGQIGLELEAAAVPA